jgi:hypothetical protein
MTYVICGNDVFKNIHTAAPAKDGTRLEIRRSRTQDGKVLPKGQYLYGIFVQHGDEKDYRVSDVKFFQGDAEAQKTMIFVADIAGIAIAKAMNPPPFEDDSDAA